MGKTKKSYNRICIERVFLISDYIIQRIIKKVQFKTFNKVKWVIPYQNIKIDQIKMCQSVSLAHQL